MNLFSFLLFTVYCLLFTSPVLALDPVIIDRSDYGAPPAQSSGDDMNYHPNDIWETDVTTCNGEFTVSNTFNPITGGTDANGNTSFIRQIIDHIESTFDLTRIYNKGPENQLMHEANRNISTELTNETFNSYDTNKPLGASNMSVRSTPYKILKCQKGQRLVLAVQSLYPNFNGTVTNEQVAWNCGGAVYTVAERTSGSGCTPVRLADIANALASQPVFYDPSADCNQFPDPITLPQSVPNPNPLSPANAVRLLSNNVEVIDNGSLTRGIEVCTTGTDDCEREEHQVPLGGVQSTDQNTVSQILPHKQVPKPVDLCQTSDRPISLNKPNPISFLVAIWRAFGEVIDEARTFTGTATVEYTIDKRVNLDKNEAFLNDLLPKTDQDKYQTTDQPGSSTEGKDYSPGAPITRTIFARNLIPLHF
jgi:hypothetical protein